MASTGIREMISAAQRSERETGQLRRRLEEKLPQLRQSLVLPETNPVNALMAFISDYVESVPGCLALVTSVSKGAIVSPATHGRSEPDGIGVKQPDIAPDFFRVFIKGVARVGII
jgi:hypothetical protein